MTTILEAAEVRATLAEIERSIDACGGRFTRDEHESGFADGYEAALNAAQNEVRRLFVRKLMGN